MIRWDQIKHFSSDENIDFLHAQSVIFSKPRVKFNGILIFGTPVGGRRIIKVMMFNSKLR